MTLEDLFRHFTDEEFQYHRFLKTRNFDYDVLLKYSNLFESIKQFALKMNLDDELNKDLNAIEKLDLTYAPHLGLFRKVLGFITFGFSTKRFIRNRSTQFYIEDIYRRHILVQSIHLILKHE
ncbi:MAG: hypothetical protein EB023_02930 [Flavobacteriia bacterium]|nr:hypothetical protein [Flavobacteriia bacterium]